MKEYDVIVVGSGPAGLSCAIETAGAGASVSIIDENKKPGGQLFKQIHKFFGSKQHSAGTRGFDIGAQLLEQTRNLGVDIFLDSVAYGIFTNKILAIEKDGNIQQIRGRKILLATGAVENSVVFPGWTLPGVMGAGAAQTMINISRVLPGRRFVIVGSGNVGLIVSYQLLQAGAEVLAVVEALPHIGGYQVHASKILRAGVPILTSSTIKEARGNMEVEEVVIANIDSEWKAIDGTEKSLTADSICIATGLHPSTRLAQMAGCELTFSSILGGHLPVHNENMETSFKEIYVSGDAAGVEEASAAMEEGRLAGIDMARKLGYLTHGEADSRREKVIQSLIALRSGPFGFPRHKAKLEIIEKSRYSN